jgi:DNA-directed RNA polymerase subunit K/omega
MADIKTRVQGLDPNVKARDLVAMAAKTGNIYEAISIIEKRASKLNVDIKHELHGKLEEFAVVTDRIEEIQENKEQIEISKFYERLPNPTLIAIEEYIADKLDIDYSRVKSEEEED